MTWQDWVQTALLCLWPALCWYAFERGLAQGWRRGVHEGAQATRNPTSFLWRDARKHLDDIEGEHLLKTLDAELTLDVYRNHHP